MWAKLNFCLILIIVGAIVYAGFYRPADAPDPVIKTTPQSIGGMRSFAARLSEGHSDKWYIANYSFPSDHYRTGWDRRNVSFNDQGMRLEINRRPTRYQPYSGAEYHRKGKYGYGRYEVVMKAARGEGLVSAFFVYTGPHYGDPHDEIDLEFLGKDTSVLHPNLFVDGQAFSPPSLQLGFDAADDFNHYAFEWDPDRVAWFVNGHEVLTLHRPAIEMPSHPGIIMANIWTGAPDQYDWHGEPRFADGANAVVRCISFQARGDQTPQCSDMEPMPDRSGTQAAAETRAP